MSLNNIATPDVKDSMSAVSAAKLVHDELLSQMPEGANHPTDCPLCIEPTGGNEEAFQGGVMATYSEEEFKSAVEEATKELSTQIAALKNSHEEAELQSKIAEATAPLETQISELQTQLDAATVEATTAKEELTNTVSYLEDLAKQDAEKAEFEALREQRVAQVTEVASFPEEYIEAHAARWASLDEEAFTAQLEDWKLIAAKASTSEKKEETKVEIPSDTAMSTSAETASQKSEKPEGMGMVTEMFNNIVRGFDPKTV